MPPFTNGSLNGLPHRRNAGHLDGQLLGDGYGVEKGVGLDDPEVAVFGLISKHIICIRIGGGSALSARVRGSTLTGPARGHAVYSRGIARAATFQARFAAPMRHLSRFSAPTPPAR
jgi:hypothetical protein